MITYELAMLLRTLPKEELAVILKRASTTIFDQGGILRKIDNLGARKMPFKTSNHGSVHREAQTHCESYFDTSGVIKREAMQQEAKQAYEKAKLDLKEIVDSDQTVVKAIAKKIYSKLLDDVLLETVSQYHRALIKGYTNHIFATQEISLLNGVNRKLKTDSFSCPHCTQLVGALYFPKHLSSCMNKSGRHTRMTNRVSATCGATSDDGDHDEWSNSSEKSSSHSKKKKMSQKARDSHKNRKS